MFNMSVRRYLGSYFNLPKLSLLILPYVFLDSFLTSICFNFSLYFSKVSGLTPIDFAQYISLFYIGSLLGSYVSGYVSLKIKPSHLSSWSSIITGFLFLALIVTVNSIGLGVIVFFIGVFTNALSTCNYANLLRTAKDDPNIKNQLINIELVIFNLCFSACAFVLLKLAAIQIEHVIAITALFLILLGLITPILTKNEVFSFLPQAKNSKAGLSVSSKKRDLLLLLLTVAIVGLIFSSIKVIFVPTIESRFENSSLAAIVASVNPWFILLAQPLVMSKATNRAIGLGVGGVIIGIGYLLFGSVTSLIPTVVSLLLLTIGEMIYTPRSRYFLVNLYSKGSEGYALGLWRAVFLGSGFFGPLIAGNLIMLYGADAVWFFCGIMGACCFLISFFINCSTEQPHVQNNNNRVIEVT